MLPAALFLRRAPALASGAAVRTLASGRSQRGLYAGKDVRTGNNVSHSVRRTRRRWLPNVARGKRLWSDALDTHVAVSVSTSALRNMDRFGGLDNYILASPAGELGSVQGERLRAQILDALGAEGYAAAEAEALEARRFARWGSAGPPQRAVPGRRAAAAAGPPGARAMHTSARTVEALALEGAGLLPEPSWSLASLGLGQTAAAAALPEAEVMRLAALARLDVSPELRASLGRDVGALLECAATLDAQFPEEAALDEHAVFHRGVAADAAYECPLRDDDAEGAEEPADAGAASAARLLGAAPDASGGMFVVPAPRKME